MKYAILLSAVLLAGCASIQRPQMMVTPHKAPIIREAPAVAPTPNITVKKRFWDRFPKHPKFFHQ